MAKKRSPWVWVAGGCGCLIVVGLVIVLAGGWFVKSKVEEFEKNPALATVRLAVMADPNLEISSVDEANETVTILNKQTGEEVTMSFKDIEEGKFSMITDEGETTIDVDQSGEGGGSMTVTGRDGESTYTAGTNAEEMPAWVPVYPGAEVAQQGFSSSSAEGRMGSRMLTVSDSFQEVVDWYEKELKDAGYDVNRTVTETGEGSYGTLAFEEAADGKSLTAIILSADGGGCTVQLQYGEKN